MSLRNATMNVAQPQLPIDLHARAGEVRSLFEQHVYGRFPGISDIQIISHQTDERSSYVLHQLKVRAARVELCVAIFVPSRVEMRAVLLGLNFFGNHAVHTDPALWLTDRWVPIKGTSRATDDTRGKDPHAWEVETAMQRGVAVATVYAGDIWPDQKGTAALGEPFADRSAGDGIGALAAWAWGLHATADAVRSIPSLSSVPIFVWGHSRQGKAALVAAAFDSECRFAGAISNQSGCGGAALFRDKVGEHIRQITGNFDYWFAPRFKDYVDREQDLPVDQHWLLGLVAPRPLLVCSAAEDSWADPDAERRAVEAARPAWTQAGADPARVEYHVRPGTHSVRPEDWETYLAFVERNL